MRSPILNPLPLVAILAVSAALASTAGCGTNSQQQHQVAYADVTSKLPGLQYQNAGDVVIHNQDELATEIKKHSNERGAQVPQFDFADKMLIIVTAGTRQTAGYELNPVSVRGNAQRLSVVTTLLPPASDNVTAQVLTYPYLAITVPKSDALVSAKIAH